YLNYANSTQRDQVDIYLNRRLGEHISDALNRGIASSASHIVIYTMQDLLRLGKEGRMNIPSTIGNNWDWRMAPEATTNDVKEKLYLWTKTYFRMNEALLESEKVKVEVKISEAHLSKQSTPYCLNPNSKFIKSLPRFANDLKSACKEWR